MMKLHHKWIIHQLKKYIYSTEIASQKTLQILNDKLLGKSYKKKKELYKIKTFLTADMTLVVSPNRGWHCGGGRLSGVKQHFLTKDSQMIESSTLKRIWREEKYSAWQAARTSQIGDHQPGHGGRQHRFGSPECLPRCNWREKTYMEANNPLSRAFTGDAMTPESPAKSSTTTTKWRRKIKDRQKKSGGGRGKYKEDLWGSFASKYLDNCWPMLEKSSHICLGKLWSVKRDVCHSG